MGKFILCPHHRFKPPIRVCPQSVVSFVGFNFSGCLFLLKLVSVVENCGIWWFEFLVFAIVGLVQNECTGNCMFWCEQEQIECCSSEVVFELAALALHETYGDYLEWVLLFTNSLVVLKLVFWTSNGLVFVVMVVVVVVVMRLGSVSGPLLSDCMARKLLWDHL